MPAHALGKKGVFRVKFQPRRIVRLVAAVARYPHVAGRAALDRPVLVIKNFRGRKSGEYLDPQPFRLLAQPAPPIAEAAGIAALVYHKTGRVAFGRAEILSLLQ